MKLKNLPVICEYSGKFFKDRVSNEVYPLVRKTRSLQGSVVVNGTQD